MNLELPDFIKYERICAPLVVNDLADFLKGRAVSVFEKIDGGNCQVRQSNFKLLPGSRSKYLRGNAVKRFPWFERFTRWTYSNSSLYNLPENLVMFGEWSGNHTIDYAPENTDQFYLIDVLDQSAGVFLPYEMAKRTIDKIGIEGVRFLDELAIGEVSVPTIESILSAPSSLGDVNKEGLVIKDYYSDRQIAAKVYHPKFAEKLKTPKGRVDYLLPQRFRKGIFRILEEGNGLVSRAALVAEVSRDVQEEEGISIPEAKIARRLRYYLEHDGLKKVSQFIDTSNL